MILENLSKLRFRHARHLLSFAFLLAVGCTSSVERKPFYCPPPPQPVCKPRTFDKVLLDTVFHGLGRIQNHITPLPDEINSPANENAIAFVPNGSGYIALVSSDRINASPDGGGRSIQRLYSAKFIRPTEYGPLTSVGGGDTPIPFGSGFYSKADGLFYFSAKAPNIDPDDYDLYVAKLQIRNDEVSMTEVKPIAALNSLNHFDSQPTLSPDGIHIYFVSDRSGGRGGTDIWVAERSSVGTQNWSEPIPLPGPVNTECDELSPYIPSYDAVHYTFRLTDMLPSVGTTFLSLTLRAVNFQSQKISVSRLIQNMMKFFRLR